MRSILGDRPEDAVYSQEPALLSGCVCACFGGGGAGGHSPVTHTPPFPLGPPATLWDHPRDNMPVVSPSPRASR